MEQLSVPGGENKIKKRRKLPVVMKSYIKPRRKRRVLSDGASFPSARIIKSEAKDLPVNSSELWLAACASGPRSATSLKAVFHFLPMTNCLTFDCYAIAAGPSADSGSRCSPMSVDLSLHQLQAVQLHAQISLEDLLPQTL